LSFKLFSCSFLKILASATKVPKENEELNLCVILYEPIFQEDNSDYPL